MILNELKLIDLSDSQNLIEIPDLSGVPNLKQLILQRCTRLYKIHASLGDLKRLIRLDLNGCKHLKILPHKISWKALETFILSGCSRLKKFPEDPMGMLNQGYGDLVSTMLRRYFINTQGQQDNEGFSLTIPGSEIPNWFSHRYVGGSANLQVPSGNKLMGIILCAVFVFRQHHPLHQLGIGDVGGMISTHHLSLTYAASAMAVFLSEEFGKIESSSDIEFKFEFEGPGLEVTKCGAHLVFERDIEDLINQTKAGSSGCIITPYDQDGFDDSEKDTKIKRSCDDSDGEGAGPSGEATSNDIDRNLNESYSFYGICTTDQLFFSLILLYEEVFGLCWKGETVTLLGDEKACGWCIDVAVLYIVWITSRLVESTQLRGSFYC
nr:disease resistance protein rpp5 [Quercus suber]